MDLPAYFTFQPRPDQPERFDQQKAFYDSRLSGVTFLIGGNGAGTTECAMAKIAKFVLSEQPPPRKDTPFWIIGPSYQQVCKSCWKEKLNGRGHIPPWEVDWERVRWFKNDQNWPFEVPLKPWPGHEGRNWSLCFKSYEQGRSEMQAESVGGFCFTEQFPWGLIEEVFRGCREYDFRGNKLAEFTPIDPNLSIQIEEMVNDGKLPEGWGVYRANTECALEAGHVTENWFRQFFGMVSDEMREVRMTGAFASLEGAIYQSFNPLVHLVGDDVIDFPPNIHHRRGIDWGGGPSNAFACVWAYRNGPGQWFVYDEYSSTDQTMNTVDHLCVIDDQWLWPENNQYYGATYADPSDPDNFKIAAKLSHYVPGRRNLWLTPAANSVLEGIEHIRWLLKPDPALMGPSITLKPQPRLFVHKERCPILSRQLRTYRWMSPQERGLNPRDARREPLKKDDHLPDALRYLLLSEARQTGAVPEGIQRETESRRLGVQFGGRSDLQDLFEKITRGAME